MTSEIGKQPEEKGIKLMERLKEVRKEIAFVDEKYYKQSREIVFKDGTVWRFNLEDFDLEELGF